MATHYVVVADVPHAESGGVTQQKYEATDNIPEVGGYIVGLAHQYPGVEIVVRVTATELA